MRINLLAGVEEDKQVDSNEQGKGAERVDKVGRWAVDNNIADCTGR